MRTTAEAPRDIPTTWEESKLEEGEALSRTDAVLLEIFVDDVLDGGLDVLDPVTKDVEVRSEEAEESCENRVVETGGFWVDSEGAPVAMTTLVICCVASGSPIDVGNSVRSVDVAGDAMADVPTVAVMTVAVFGRAPETVLQMLYTPIDERSLPEQSERMHCTDPSPIVRPEVLLSVQRSDKSEVEEQSVS